MIQRKVSVGEVGNANKMSVVTVVRATTQELPVAVIVMRDEQNRPLSLEHVRADEDSKIARREFHAS